MAHWIVPIAGAAAVAFAALMLAQRSLYAAAICFLGVILQAAVILHACGGRLLAFLLVLIYAGAVAVLIVVSIHAADSAGPGRTGSAWSPPSLPRPLLLVGFLLPLAEAAVLLAGGVGGQAASARPGHDLGLGHALFGPYALAAEAAALLLLFAALAVIGAEEGRS